jgi:myotubularin-related protein 5/13
MILTLATTFHRKLSEEATQFIYTDIQRHAVWANMQFWEMSFYSDVQLQIRNLYLSHEDSNANNSDLSTITDSLSTSSTDTVTHQGSTTNESSLDNSSHQNGTIIHEKTALEIAAEQMRLSTQKISEEQRSIEELEEQTLYALAIHYIQLMVYMKLPLDISSSTNIRHSIYNHGSHVTTGDADSVTSDFYHSSNDPFQFVLRKFLFI